MKDYRGIIENFFFILDKETQQPTHFRLNKVQSKYYKILLEEYADFQGVREIILKARQEGMCVAYNTRILTSDLQWTTADSIKVGQKIVAVDEFSSGGRGIARKMKTATVEAKNIVNKEAFCLKMDDGRELIATAEHKFLMKTRGGSKVRWRTVAETEIGDEIRYITKPWTETTIEDAWFGGFTDGEGTMRPKLRAGVEFSVCQVENGAWEKAVQYITTQGYTHRIDWDIRMPGVTSKLGNKPVGRIYINRMDELFKLHGKTRPIRFLNKKWWEDKELPGKHSGIGWSKVVSITPLGKRKMIDLQTSAKTFIAEGFVSHNSSIVLAMFTVDFLMVPYSVSICISHRKDATELLFKKVKFFLESYCQNKKIPYENLFKTDNKNLIEHATNGAMFYVGTAGAKVGGRGGSASNILFSETAFYMDTAKITASEIVTATAQQVPQDRGMIFIESTGNSTDDYYNAEWERARRGESTYKPRFFGWQEFYDEVWVEKKKKEFPNELIAMREYPKDEAEAFLAAGSPYFDNLYLAEMLNNRQQPVAIGRLAADGQFT